jgi:hypothetical protein
MLFEFHDVRVVEMLADLELAVLVAFVLQYVLDSEHTVVGAEDLG